MLREIGNRAAQMVLVFFVFITILFFMLHLAPGDITTQLALDPNIPFEERQRVIERLGLDRPLHEQYLVYIRNLLQGEFGVSFIFYPTNVGEVLWVRLPRTLVLFTVATLLSYWMGYVVGKILAWRREGFVEYATTIVGVLLYTVFLPWFALIMIWIFSFIIPVFPLRGFLTPSLWRGAPFGATAVFNAMVVTSTVLLVALGIVWLLSKRVEQGPLRSAVANGGAALAVGGYAVYWFLHPMRPFAANIAYHSTLPTLTLTLVSFAGVMLLMRTSMLETLREDYILTARAKGVADKRVRDKHAARNALLPVVTTLVLSVAFIISGGIVTETVFAWPGLGEAFLRAATVGDIPLALGCMILIGIVALIAHLVVDVLYAYLDPRIRY